MAWATLYVLNALQSKKLWPAPFACAVWHLPPQHPGVVHSQPSVSGAVAALQSVSPVLHLYEHVVPSQLAGPVFVLHFAAHPPQLVVDEATTRSRSCRPRWCPQLAKPTAAAPAVRAARAGARGAGAVGRVARAAAVAAVRGRRRSSSRTRSCREGSVVASRCTPSCSSCTMPRRRAPGRRGVCTCRSCSGPCRTWRPQAVHEFVGTVVSQPFVSGAVASRALPVAGCAAHRVYVHVVPSHAARPCCSSTCRRRSRIPRSP